MSAFPHIVVVGAGAAGLSCAISAATHGARVHLVEQSPVLGGTVAHSLIHTIGGLYDDAGHYLNVGLPVTLTEALLQADAHTRQRQMGKVWVLSVDPAIYERVITEWLARLSTITVWRNTTPIRVHTQGARVDVLEVACGQETCSLPVDALVDATGSAAVVRLLDARKVVPGAALAGLIIQLRGVAPNALTFPKNVGVQRQIQHAVTESRLPFVFARTWFDQGVYPDEVYAKLNILAADYDAAALPDWQARLMDCLHALPDFAHGHITRVGRLGIRDGGRVQGEYCLTVEDVKSGCTFPDAVGRCAWPIEYWDPDKGVTLDYLPPGQSYSIPLRSLKVAGVDNLWVAGKCFSAEHLAQASARVAGTCWAMGDALGKVLAQYS